MWPTAVRADRRARPGWLASALLLAACGGAPPVLVGAEPPPEGAFTLVVMPDTQGYIHNYKWDDALTAQTRWIAQNAAAHDIRYTIHLGDIVNNNRTTQWKLARKLFDVLHDGDRVRVPYALVPGNHDMGPNGNAENRWTLMTRDEYFGRGSPYGRQPTIGGFYDPQSTTNTWHEFEAGGKKWLILALEFGPRDDVVRWAGEVLAGHPDHRAIVVTHAYLYSSNARYQFLPYAGSQFSNPSNYPFEREADSVNDGEALWQKLISKHANVRMVFSGHVLEDGEGRMTSVGDHGQVVHQMVQNYQPGVYDSEFGGNGYFRLLEFWPDGQTVRVRTYSPHLGKYHTAAGHEFFLSLQDDPVGLDYPSAVFADRPLVYYRPWRDVGSAVANRVDGRSDLDGTYEGDGEGPWAFDGDDLIGTNTALPRLPQWSIEAWVRLNRRGSRQVLFTNDRPGVEMKSDEPTGTGTGTTGALPLSFDDDVILGIAPEGSRFTEGVAWTVVHRDPSGARTIAESPLRTLVNRWSHVVATGDGERLRLYVDGDLAREVEAAAEALDLAGVPARIGRSEHIQGAAFDGVIAEVALYDHPLSAADVVEHRMAAFSRVTAARIEVAGSVDPDGEESEGITVVEQGMPGLSVTLANRGDLQVFLGGAEAKNPAAGSPGGSPAVAGEGVLLATVAENSRSGVVGSAASSWNSWRHGIVGVSMTQVGAGEEEVVIEDDTSGEDGGKPSVRSLYDVELTVLNEINIDVALAWFPFRGGWRGGHVRADGALLGGSGVTQAMVRLPDGATMEDGRVWIDLGVDAAGEGLLFALGADGKNRVAVAGPREDGPGWEVRLQSNSVRLEGVERPTLEEVLDRLEIPDDERDDYEDRKLLTWDSFAFVYLPFEALYLVGGMYDGVADESRRSTGEFALARLDTGEYELRIEGQTPETGVLVLTGADLAGPRNVALTYEGDDTGAFQIRAWEVETAEPRDTVFAWAFIGYTEPPSLPQ